MLEIKILTQEGRGSTVKSCFQVARSALKCYEVRLELEEVDLLLKKNGCFVTALLHIYSAELGEPLSNEV